MWMEKIRHGVLQVETRAGLRYVEPKFTERVRLLWTFRNFTVLSEQVLNPNERHLLGQLCVQDRLKLVRGSEQAPGCVIGTVENVTMIQPPKKHAVRVASNSSRQTA